MAGLYPRLRLAARPQLAADRTLAEEVAAQNQLGGLVTTKADAADGCDGIGRLVLRG